MPIKPATNETRQKRAVRLTRATLRGRTIEQDKDETLQNILRGASSQQIADPFAANQLYAVANTGELRIVSPPVSVAALLRMPNDNSILRQCIEAMVVNTEGHGSRLEYVGPDGMENSKEAMEEKAHIEEFLTLLNPECTLTEMRKRARFDKETLGFAFYEVLRSKDGLPIGLTQIPAHTMRLTTIDTEEVSVPVKGKRFGKAVNDVVKRRFRRFVQLVGTQKVWFKEYGDPRTIDPTSGQVNNALAHEDSATEVVMMRQYVPGELYGLPRWWNNVVAIQGSRQAELTNLDYFKENAIPALAVLVSGGYLDRDVVEQLEEHLTAARGRASQNRIMLIEVEGDELAASSNGQIPQPRVDIKPLAGDRPTDGLFLEYDKAQTDKVRSSFRLPPVFTGHSQDYSHAAVKTSYEVAEGQVFGPERSDTDEVLNHVLLKPHGVKYWELRSNAPRIADQEEVNAAIKTFNEVGAMTPNVAIGLANEQFDLKIPMIEEAWGDYPFAIVNALATAGKLKGLEEILAEIDDEMGLDEDTDPNLGHNGGPPFGDEEDDEGATASRNASRMIRHQMRNLANVLDKARVARTDQDHPEYDGAKAPAPSGNRRKKKPYTPSAKNQEQGDPAPRRRRVQLVS